MESLTGLAIVAVAETLIIWGVAAWWVSRKRAEMWTEFMVLERLRNRRRVEWDDVRAEIREDMAVLDWLRRNADKKWSA